MLLDNNIYALRLKKITTVLRQGFCARMNPRIYIFNDLGDDMERANLAIMQIGVTNFSIPSFNGYYDFDEEFLGWIERIDKFFEMCMCLWKNKQNSLLEDSKTMLLISRKDFKTNRFTREKEKLETGEK